MYDFSRLEQMPTSLPWCPTPDTDQASHHTLPLSTHRSVLHRQGKSYMIELSSPSSHSLCYQNKQKIKTRLILSVFIPEELSLR